MEIIPARTEEHMDRIGSIFREYEQFLGVDLSFQKFEEELAGLPGKYAPPHGQLLMAVDGRDVAGCVALRNLGDGVCEMKRLFVRPQYRARGIGRRLVQAIVHEAVGLDYGLMRLDTLDRLKEAIELYASFGFRETQPYCNNPLPGVVFLELTLSGTCRNGDAHGSSSHDRL